MQPVHQVLTLRDIFIIPAPGVWATRLARLAAAKWAQKHGVRITKTNITPSEKDGVLGYGVRVTLPPGANLPNRHETTPYETTPIASA